MVCNLPFPLKDVNICSCGHWYHPWCAIIWFKFVNSCKDQLCEGLVHPEWFESFGFREPTTRLEEKVIDMDCEMVHQKLSSKETNYHVIGNFRHPMYSFVFSCTLGFYTLFVS